VVLLPALTNAPAHTREQQLARPGRLKVGECTSKQKV
jgi:hypothetical protein